MEYDQDEQYRRADIIIEEICKVGGVTYADFLYRKRSLQMNILRGVAFYLSWEYGVHARRMGIMTHRSRCNVINQSKRYRYYIRTGDPVSCELYYVAKENIEKRIDSKKTLK